MPPFYIQVISLPKGEAVGSISKFLIGDRFHVIGRILSPEILFK